jgi:aspartyl aminopeptidase
MIPSEIIRFLDTSLTSIHGAAEISTILTERGSRPLHIGDSWSVAPGEAVHVVLSGTVVAFRAGTDNPDTASVVIGAAHTDSPGLQLKERSARVVDGFLQIPVEVYGGPILATWLDRELLVAGRIAVHDDRAGSGVKLLRFSSRRPWAIIPNLAIHFNREMNESLTYNRQDHLKALIPLETGNPDGSSGGELFRRIVAGAADIDVDGIVDMELQLLPAQPATPVGPDNGLISSARIDNLAGCMSLLDGFTTAQTGAEGHSSMAIFYDHEEIGSTTAFGAAGDVTRHTLLRFLRALCGRDADHDAVVSRSVLVSNDCAHGRHPNYADKHDDGYAPTVGGGPVIKKSAARRYATELDIAAWFGSVCRRKNIPVQYLQNRSDIPAGSTIGPAVASRLMIPGVDVGIPMLAMHSARETVHIRDIDLMAQAFREVFSGGYR